MTINSFQCEHYSWPTADDGVFARLVTLPVPYSGIAWNQTNTTGKVLLIGAEVTSDKSWYLAFRMKLQDETPSAVIFRWSTSRMALMPPVFDSCGGRPNDGNGPFFWSWKIPVGWVSYDDGQLISSKITAENASAFVSVRAAIVQGPHYNVVGKLLGSVDPEKMIIISAHYDSVMDAAFCDNGAGTAALIELARVFSEASREGIYKPQYTLVFIAFAGEELGLVGSVNYFEQHASELSNIVAIINLDSLGSETMEISKSFPDNRGLDLQRVVMNAGNDLGVAIDLTDPRARLSDHQTFLDPADTDDLYLDFWGVRAGIRNMTRVRSSITIDSYPLSWIHTENDNSTSTATLGWVTVDNLENQTRVTGLSVMRVSSMIFSPFQIELYGSSAITVAVIVVAAYLERLRLRALYWRATHEVRSYIGMKEVVYTIILTAIFLFLSFLFSGRVANAEVMIRTYYPKIVTIYYYGTPFEMFGIVPVAPSGSGHQHRQSAGAGITLLWGGLLANIVLFSFGAFIVTFAVTKARYKFHR